MKRPVTSLKDAKRARDILGDLLWDTDTFDYVGNPDQWCDWIAVHCKLIKLCHDDPAKVSVDVARLEVADLAQVRRKVRLD